MERGQAVMLTPYSGLREFGGEAVDVGDLAGELGSGAGRDVWLAGAKLEAG